PPNLAAALPGAVCATVSGPEGVTAVRMGAPAVESTGVATAGSAAVPGTVYVDHVIVRPGAGSLVAATASAGSGAAPVSLVTDLGLRYALAGDEVLGMLGYAGRTPLRLPAEVVALLPAGPALDPQTARLPAA
ncbi:MAG: type VII secretion protein EccB, partial [Dactylosporangium sp.]|nr:type VII secretion protein EccB [Dactylosporangium sp.]NNJ61991.1 type VII secretion protein EccB [Dactylosporangium sp.]